MHQGSTLSLLLLRVFTNYICHSINNSQCFLFVNGLKIYGISSVGVCKCLHHDFDSVKIWRIGNVMKVSLGKTTIISFLERQQCNLITNLVSRSKRIKDLDFIFDCKLYYH